MPPRSKTQRAADAVQIRRGGATEPEKMGRGGSSHDLCGIRVECPSNLFELLLEEEED